MVVHIRYFKVGDEWSVVYLPERPNGFAIMLLGDANHYISENESFWLTHPERRAFLEQLLDNGYTIFSSHLYGAHWGSERAFEVVRSLYYLVCKQEIINRRIHVIAEGIGGLLAIKMMARMHQHLRSITLINPCLHLYRHYKQEKKQKFFLKRFIRELSQAYEIELEDIEKKLFVKNNEWKYHHHIPVQIFHDMSQQRFNFKDHSRRYEIYRKKVESPIALSLQLPGKPFDYFIRKVMRFMKNHERFLQR